MSCFEVCSHDEVVPILVCYVIIKKSFLIEYLKSFVLDVLFMRFEFPDSDVMRLFNERDLLLVM